MRSDLLKNAMVMLKREKEYAFSHGVAWEWKQSFYRSVIALILRKEFSFLYKNLGLKEACGAGLWAALFLLRKMGKTIGRNVHHE
jgi:hypothetical protein